MLCGFVRVVPNNDGCKTVDLAKGRRAWCHENLHAKGLTSAAIRDELVAVMGRKQESVWCSAFRESLMTLEDEPRLGRLRSSTTDGNYGNNRKSNFVIYFTLQYFVHKS
jgi:hypothetical protein